MKLISKIFLFLFGLSAMAAAQQEYSLTLEQAIELGLQNHQQLKIAAANVDVSRLQLQTAKNQMLPSVEFSANAFYLGDVTILNSDWSKVQTVEMPHFGNTFGLQASQLLYKGGVIRKSIEIAELKMQLAELDRTSNEQDIKFLIISNYLDIQKLLNQIKVLSQLYLPQLLSGYGMGALMIGVWIYQFDKVPPQMDVILPSVAPVMVFRSFIMLGFFTTLFGWLQYKFQIQSVGDLAVYFDAMMMSHNPGAGGLRDVQLSAILVANKKLLGYIIITGLGILTFTLLHSFGMQKYAIARYILNSKQSDEHAVFIDDMIDQNMVQKILNILKKRTKEEHDMNKKLFATHVRHFKERHAEATSQIPNLVKKVKQVDDAGNKVKEVFKYIPASIKESIEKEKERNRELREIRRSRRKSKTIEEPSDEIVILGMRIKLTKKAI